MTVSKNEFNKFIQEWEKQEIFAWNLMYFSSIQQKFNDIVIYFLKKDDTNNIKIEIIG